MAVAFVTWCLGEICCTLRVLFAVEMSNNEEGNVCFLLIIEAIPNGDSTKPYDSKGPFGCGLDSHLAVFV